MLICIRQMLTVSFPVLINKGKDTICIMPFILCIQRMRGITLGECVLFQIEFLNRKPLYSLNRESSFHFAGLFLM
jgi:hypothetical protein